MTNEALKSAVLVVPCSGIGKVHGLISREATCLVSAALKASGEALEATLSLGPKGLTLAQGIVDELVRNLSAPAFLNRLLGVCRQVTAFLTSSS